MTAFEMWTVAHHHSIRNKIEEIPIWWIMSLLSSQQIETFLRDGLLVVQKGFLSAEQLANAQAGLHATLARHGVDTKDLVATGANLTTLSSTAGSGGVLDVFYDEWKMNIALHPVLHAWTRQLWQAAYCYQGETSWQDLAANEQFKWHPYGPVDHANSGGYVYIDRICYRLPTALSDEIGRQTLSSSSNVTNNNKKKNKKKLSLQRSLTPHLDCCPDTYDDPTHHSKWRPIQCFVSLTDNMEPNTGGLEVAKGFHREFRHWAATRAPTVVKDRQTGQTNSIPAPCLGEYTHMRPAEDAAVMQRVQHVPVAAGAVVFWDNRLPHANAYRHDGSQPRAVAYCSFLPPIALNRAYAQQQLQAWLAGRTPTDQWRGNAPTTSDAATMTNTTTSSGNTTTSDTNHRQENDEAVVNIELLRQRLEKLPALSRQLLALEDW